MTELKHCPFCGSEVRLETYQAELIALRDEVDKFVTERTIQTIQKNEYIFELEQLCRDLRDCAIHTICATCVHENSACAIERFYYLQL